MQVTLGAVMPLCRYKEDATSLESDCRVNAVMAGLFVSRKSEWIDGEHYLTREQARRDVIEYMRCTTTASGCTRRSATRRRETSGYPLLRKTVSVWT